MRKYKNRFKKFMVLLCTVATLIVSSVVNVLADETSVGDETVVINGVELPFYPDEINGRDYILLSYNGYVTQPTVIYRLFIFESSSVVTMLNSYSENDKNFYLSIGGISGVDEYRCYEYSISDGWVLSSEDGSTIVVSSGNGPTIHKSTVNIYLASDITQLEYAKNADIIGKNDISVFLGDFGALLTGSVGIISSSTVGVVGAFLIIIPAVVGLFYSLLWR